MYTQKDCDCDVEHYERERAQLRQLFLAGQVAEAGIDSLAKGIEYRLGPRRLDGIEFKRRDDELVRKISACEKRVQASRFFTGQRMGEREREKGDRGHWRGLKTEAEALALKHRGSKVRMTGVKKNPWEVLE